MAYTDQGPTGSDFGDSDDATGGRLGGADTVGGEGLAPVPQPVRTTDPASSHDSTDEKKDVAARASDRAQDVAGTAKDEAGAIKDTAMAAGSDVADSVTQQAGNVAHEVGHQSRRLLDEGVSELQTQAGAGQQRLAELSRSLGDELRSMTTTGDSSGPITDLATNAQGLFDDAAHWLEHNEPGDVLESVRRYASRNPWTFLAISAGVGFVGARIVRGLQSKDQAPQPASDVPRAYHGSSMRNLSPVEDPAYEGGPRYGSQDRVQPSATPGMQWETSGTAGIDEPRFLPPGQTPSGGQRGL